MKFIYPLSVGAVISSATAARFTLPIYKEDLGHSLSQPLSHFKRRDVESQFVLGRPAGKSDEGDDAAKPNGAINYSGSWVYTTNVSIGTPPQTFRAVVDLNWSDLFVPSIACHGDHCDALARYNSSASSTWSENDTRTDIAYGPVVAYGRVSKDALSLGSDLQLPDFNFIELNYYEQVWPDVEAQWFDGALGLSVNSKRGVGLSNPVNLPGPFRHLVNEDILDENMFSITWPKDHSTAGSLTFGGYDVEKFDRDLVRHPLLEDNNTDWKIAVDQLYVKKEGSVEAVDMVKDSSWPEWSAMMLSHVPVIGLPATLANAFFAEMDHHYSQCLGGIAVDCNKLSELPDLIIGFKGQNITLTGEDYVEKVTPPEYFCHDAPDECMVLIDALPSFDGFPSTIMIFGTSFLKKVHGIFDWDRKSISFGERKD